MTEGSKPDRATREIFSKRLKALQDRGTQSNTERQLGEILNTRTDGLLQGLGFDAVQRAAVEADTWTVYQQLKRVVSSPAALQQYAENLGVSEESVLKDYYKLGMQLAHREPESINRARNSDYSENNAALRHLFEQSNATLEQRAEFALFKQVEELVPSVFSNYPKDLVLFNSILADFEKTRADRYLLDKKNSTGQESLPALSRLVMLLKIYNALFRLMDSQSIELPDELDNPGARRIYVQDEILGSVLGAMTRTHRPHFLNSIDFKLQIQRDLEKRMKQRKVGKKSA